jgi:activator of HSP90 ATPase
MRRNRQPEIRNHPECMSKVGGRPMTPPIVQRTYFDALPERLFALYMDPKEHAAFTGGKVEISSTPGSRFSAFDGVLSGATLFTVPGRMIVQRWRSTQWREDDLDSILTMLFVRDGSGGAIELTHVNVPEHDHDGVTQGWQKYYYEPLRAYLARQSISKS